MIMRYLFNKLPLKVKLISLICLVFILSVIAQNIYIIHVVNNEYLINSRQRVENIASIISTSQTIIDKIQNPTLQNIAAIQATTEQTRALTQIDFIVIFNMQGVRYSHPDKNKIGQTIVGGDEQRALNGESYTSIAKGTLGDSVRAFKPIMNEKHQQIGAVLVGQTLQKINHLASRTSQPIWLSLFASLTIAIILAYLLSHNIKKILYGLEPIQMAQLFAERNAIIRTVKEGIVVINRNGLITQINDEAIRILRIDDDKENIIGLPIKNFIPNTRLHEVMMSGNAEYDCEQNINGVVILTNRTPLFVNDALVGAIASFRDMTEVRKLAENLTGVNRYADALRSQSHEFNNKLHVIYGLAFNDNKQELMDYLEQIIGNQQAESKLVSQYIKDPIIAGFLNSKFSRARELNVTLEFNIDGVLAPITDTSVIHSLVTILGNLIDNGLDAVQFLDDKQIKVSLVIDNSNFEIEINDNGEGISEKDIQYIFQKGYSTKGDNRGFGLYLVLASIDELDGHIQLCDLNNKKGTCFKVLLPLKEIYRNK
ncbi:MULTISPECIES: DcuS/MalK family sensor histidine kinase [Gilliamella]|uniref:histidine kinase n=2 Tax=Orbaceae TaxID=1240483 RepID=A0A242NT83_9GAMM|nr:two-component system sensor histidine kinase DcuS [Gilliamella apis]OTQ35883.1 two-component system sensor histidine kinase DcuS [Gilliamella apis]OTQ41587.1 two-component system sensor histidine kinase DcuS [Gilliamella apis]OTQ43771.1 two-component system sensor histidine kinase DcuS [Gilliamella apis]OTQ47065.1 two-component system sensor histidine kinase DcuS [Gilliamella apis]